MPNRLCPTTEDISTPFLVTQLYTNRIRSAWGAAADRPVTTLSYSASQQNGFMRIEHGNVAIALYELSP
ncbi:MAG: hypothetical protein AAGE92_16260 [Cyanobacteria bacterium P01_G01_bin.4]